MQGFVGGRMLVSHRREFRRREACNILSVLSGGAHEFYGLGDSAIIPFCWSHESTINKMGLCKAPACHLSHCQLTSEVSLISIYTHLLYLKFPLNN